MDDSTHAYGTKTSTSKTLSSIKDTTFKNLRGTSGTVTFEAKWTGPNITLPTVTKKGYKCIWKSDSSTWSSGGTYKPANTKGATSRTFTASCEKDNPATDLDGYDNRYCTIHNAKSDGTLATGAGGSSTIACDSDIKESSCRESYNWQGYGGGKANTNPAYCDRYNDCWSNGGNTYANITLHLIHIK